MVNRVASRTVYVAAAVILALAMSCDETDNAPVATKAPRQSSPPVQGDGGELRDLADALANMRGHDGIGASVSHLDVAVKDASMNEVVKGLREQLGLVVHYEQAAADESTIDMELRDASLEQILTEIHVANPRYLANRNDDGSVVVYLTDSPLARGRRVFESANKGFMESFSNLAKEVQDAVGQDIRVTGGVFGSFTTNLHTREVSYSVEGSPIDALSALFTADDYFSGLSWSAQWLSDSEVRLTIGGGGRKGLNRDSLVVTGGESE